MLRFQRGLGQVEILAIRGQDEIRPRHLGHQSNLRASTSLFRGEVLLQPLFFQIADAAEQIHFPGDNAQIDIVLLGGPGVPGRCQIGGGTLLAATGRRIERGKQLGSLNAIDGAGPLHVQGSQPKIEVVRQGHRNDLLELRVRENVLPPKLRDNLGLLLRGWAVGVGRSARQAGGDRSLRPGVFRGHHAPVQQQGRSNRSKKQRFVHIADAPSAGFISKRCSAMRRFRLPKVFSINT